MVKQSFREQLKTQIQKTILKMFSHASITWFIILGVASRKWLDITGEAFLLFTIATIGIKSAKEYYKIKLNGQ